MRNEEASILGGAIGDAFGAPLEGIMKLSELKKFGKNGLQEFIPYKSFWDDAEPEGLGIITDDTTMTACTFAGIIEAAKNPEGNFVQKAVYQQWQYYLSWGSYQCGGEKLAKFVEPETIIPDYLKPFLFRCGAGKGTIAALLTGNLGTIDAPVEYNTVIDGKAVKSPNAGCGGMMRIAPIAFLYRQADIDDFALGNAAITHGHPDALNATAVMAGLVKNCLVQDDLATALKQTKSELCLLSMSGSVTHAWQKAEEYINNKPLGMETINELGRSFDKNPFLAQPVLSQVIYSLYAASKMDISPQSFKETIRLAANHTGDSDSVAACVGNCLGALGGEGILPMDWLDKLPMKNDLITLNQEWEKTTHHLKLI